MEKRKKILYIEDDPNSRILVRKILEHEGFVFLEAEDGISGVAVAERETPDLILMDINIPGMDGYETATKIKSVKNLENVPIVAVTASAMKGDKDKALVAGCDGYICKPIEVKQFPIQVREFLVGRKEHIEEQGKEVSLLKEYTTKLVARLEEKIKELTESNIDLEHKVAERTKELQAANKLLEELSIRDDLTKLYNRRYFEKQLAIEFQRYKRFAHSLSLILFDLDNFKKINDTYGHQFGDRVLCEVANAIVKNVREVDFVFRYGGEEFIVLLPITTIEDTYVIAERLRCVVGKLTFEVPSLNDTINATLSGGCVSVSYKKVDDQAELVERADKALYEAKRAGKNKIIIWQEKLC
jgi:diguanylate cyclase (GGDEF)-like protein